MEQSQEYQSTFINKIYEKEFVNDFLVGEGNEENWNLSLARAVMNAHNGRERHDALENPLPDTDQPPKLMFVTATSAIPYAFAIKEAWKTAFPEETPPKVFFVDVSKQRFGNDNNYERLLTDGEIEIITQSEIDRLRNLGERYESFENALVFDEFENTGRTLRKVQELLENAGFSNTNFLHGRWGHVYPWMVPDEMKPVIRKGAVNPGGKTGTPYRRLKIQVTDDSKKVTSDMRKIGLKMGEEIKKHFHPAEAV